MTGYTIDGREVCITFEKNAGYSLNDIQLACNDISDKCSAFISKTNDKILVTLETENAPETLLKEFMYRLSEQQTRDILLKQNVKIRDLIVEHAFKPIASLKDRIDV